MSPEDYTNNGGYFMKWKVTASIVLDVRAWITDDEYVDSHQHSKRLSLEIEAGTPEEALELALQQVKDKKWHSVSVSKELAPRHFQTYSKYNDVLYDEAYAKYVRG